VQEEKSQVAESQQASAPDSVSEKIEEVNLAPTPSGSAGDKNADMLAQGAWLMAKMAEFMQHMEKATSNASEPVAPLSPSPPVGNDDDEVMIEAVIESGSVIETDAVPKKSEPASAPKDQKRILNRSSDECAPKRARNDSSMTTDSKSGSKSHNKPG
jgi:hypothetical protein